MKSVRRKGSEFKGIVLSGFAGTGKSTAAKLLLERIPRSIYLEVSDLILSAASETLPRWREDFLKAIAISNNQPKIPRAHARGIFVTLRKRYGKTIIAEAIETLHRSRCARRFLILGGVRKYEDARYFRDCGYYLAHLAAPKKVLGARLVRRNKQKLREVYRELREEERLYQTSKISRVAHASLDSSTLRPARIVGKILDDIGGH